MKFSSNNLNQNLDALSNQPITSKVIADTRASRAMSGVSVGAGLYPSGKIEPNCARTRYSLSQMVMLAARKCNGRINSASLGLARCT